MPSPLFTRDQLDAAAALVYSGMAPTPQYRWPLLEARLGGTLWVKHENHTPTGAFKVRGGLVYLDDLAKSPERPGLVTATRGNHGQSIPFAARKHGFDVRVYAPETNSPEKNAAMRAWGADLRLHGADFDTARREAMRVAGAEDLHMIPSFHPLLVRGVATYALELFTAAPDLDTVYVPVGLGSGICGLIATRDLLGLKTEIVGVVAERADSYALSFETGTLTATGKADTFIDGVACGEPNPEAVEIIAKGADRFVRVTEDEAAEAIRILLSDTHNLAEPAGAIALAAALKERDRAPVRKTSIILTGGNIDRLGLTQILSGETPTPG